MTKSKIFKSTIAAAACSMILAACGDDSSSNSSSKEDSNVESSASGDEIVSISDKNISGVSQKGPFVKGSSVKVFELDENYKQTGKSFTGKIEKDDGAFAIESVELASQFAVLEASGYYRNEVSGEKSKGTITLSAITDLSEREKVNVNLLTHLEYDRAMYLIKNDSMSVVDAKAQAEKEIFKAFGIEGEFANSEDLDIFSKGEGNAALLAISILMQGDRDEAGITEFLSDFASDIKEDGTWDDESAKVKVADWALDVYSKDTAASIRSNIESWKLGEVPEFEKYIARFAADNLDLGACDKDSEGKVVAVENEKSAKYDSDERVICKDGAWVLATDQEKDTFGWKAPKGDKETDLVKFGDITKKQYVYDGYSWREPEVWEMYGQSHLDSAYGTYSLASNDSTLVEDAFIIKAAICGKNNGTKAYVAYKVNGSFFCKPNGDALNGYPEYDESAFDRSSVYDGAHYCDLHAYECNDYNWTLVKSRLYEASEIAKYKESYGSWFDDDGILYFSKESLRWYKYDKTNDDWFDYTSYPDVSVMQRYHHGDAPSVPQFRSKDGGDVKEARDFEGMPSDDEWTLAKDWKTESKAPRLVCNKENVGDVVYFEKTEYDEHEGIYACLMNTQYRADEGYKDGIELPSWELLTSGNDVWAFGLECTEENDGEIVIGKVSKFLKYKCSNMRWSSVED